MHQIQQGLTSRMCKREKFPYIHTQQWKQKFIVSKQMAPTLVDSGVASKGNRLSTRLAHE